jgi:hypothetical protein
VTEFESLGGGRRCFWFPREMTIGILILWTIAVFVHLGRAWSPGPC